MGYVDPGKRIDLEKLGGTLVLGAAVILAIRTARRAPAYNLRESNRDWDEEIDFALKITNVLLSRAMSHHAELFRQTVVKFTEGVVEEDVMK